MDIYLISLTLGGAGLGIMTLSGLGRHGAEGHDAHAGHLHHGHDAHAGAHLPGHSSGGHAPALPSAHANGAQHVHHASTAHHDANGVHGHGAHDRSALSNTVWSLMSPRVLFSVLLGFGATGLLVRGPLGGVAATMLAPLVFAIAVCGGIALEKLVVAPLWNFLFRFASTPAQTIESTLFDEARAASGFDANGEGLVTLEVDGQVVQVLGRLRSEDRELGVRVHVGDRLRVEDVDGERHRCTVSYLGR